MVGSIFWKGFGIPQRSREANHQNINVMVTTHSFSPETLTLPILCTIACAPFFSSSSDTVCSNPDMTQLVSIPWYYQHLTLVSLGLKSHATLVLLLLVCLFVCVFACFFVCYLGCCFPSLLHLAPRKSGTSPLPPDDPLPMTSFCPNPVASTVTDTSS